MSLRRHFAVALSLCAFVSTPAFAKANCKAYPKVEWMKEADAKAKMEAQGYTISKFKVDGNCYEIYGRNKAGKKGRDLLRRQDARTGEERD